MTTTIGLLKEGKIPPDNRVALTPAQCKWLQKNFPGLRILVQSAPHRCYTDSEYKRAGVELRDDLGECDILLGIKEVPVDYECLEHEDGQRIIGFGFFAGVVGAHNGMMAYGLRTGSFRLGRVYQQKDFKDLIHTYFGLKLPNIKIAVTGSGRVAHGILEVMNLMEVIEVEKEEYLYRNFSYPVYVQLKGSDLYAHKTTGGYNRDHFHAHAEEYRCLFDQYLPHTDILMNGIYWDQDVPRLFSSEQVAGENFRIQVIADVTDDSFGSVPINLGDQDIEHPVYGVDRKTLQKTAPYLPGSVDVMAVGNLPNELPRDASKYFGEQLIKYIIADLLQGGSRLIDGATILRNGKLTEKFMYLQEYAGVKE